MTIVRSTRDLIRHIANGEITTEAYAESLLERCRTLAHLNAFIAIDEDQVREAAKARDAERSVGAALGPLHGLPVVVKDNIYTRDLPTTGGTPAFTGFRPGRDASTVRALLDDGAIILGKTNLHELAFGVTSNNGRFGAVGNPYDPARIAGGSSGGTAAAIGAGMATAGLGTDTGGSTRIPASLCGVAGFRPSVGRYGGDGVMTMSRTRDTVGPMASDVAGLRLLDAAMAFGVADADIMPPLHGLRLGYPRRMIEQLAAPEMDAAFAGVVAALRDAGAAIVAIELSDLMPLNARASIPIALYEVRREWIAFLNEALGIGLHDFVASLASPDVGRLFGMIANEPLPGAVYANAVGVDRRAMRHLYGRRFAEHGLAAIIRPTTPVTAAPIATCATVQIGTESVDIFSALTRFTDPGSVAGLPSVTVPAGMVDGLPFGLDLDGPIGGDSALLAVAAAVEAALGPIAPPSLSAAR
jgi:mandelamide amidase